MVLPTLANCQAFVGEGLAPPRLEGCPGLPVPTPHLNTNTAPSRKKPNSRGFFSFWGFFPQKWEQGGKLVHGRNRWFPGTLTTATEALPPPGITNIDAVLGAPIPLKNRLQLVPDGAGGSSGTGGSASTGSSRCLRHHQRRSCRPREVIARPVGRPCEEI